MLWMTPLRLMPRTSELFDDDVHCNYTCTYNSFIVTCMIQRNRTVWNCDTIRETIYYLYLFIFISTSTMWRKHYDKMY